MQQYSNIHVLNVQNECDVGESICSAREAESFAGLLMLCSNHAKWADELGMKQRSGIMTTKH